MDDPNATETDTAANAADQRTDAAPLGEPDACPHCGGDIKDKLKQIADSVFAAARRRFDVKRAKVGAFASRLDRLERLVALAVERMSMTGNAETRDNDRKEQVNADV
jgi:hypothetical protein